MSSSYKNDHASLKEKCKMDSIHIGNMIYSLLNRLFLTGRSTSVRGACGGRRNCAAMGSDYFYNTDADLDESGEEYKREKGRSFVSYDDIATQHRVSV